MGLISLCSIASDYNSHNVLVHLIDWFHLTEYQKSLLLIDWNDSFHFFCAKYDLFIWLSNFIFKICASSNTIEYVVWTSGVAKDSGAMNILPWSVFDVRKIQKRKDWSCLEVCRIHEKQKRSQIKPRNHEESKIQRLRNATQTYYCDVSRWRRFGTEPQPLFSISCAWNMHRLPKNTQNSQRLN